MRSIIFFLLFLQMGHFRSPIFHLVQQDRCTKKRHSQLTNSQPRTSGSPLGCISSRHTKHSFSGVTAVSSVRDVVDVEGFILLSSSIDL
jgi:hypothetical protein